MMTENIKEEKIQKIVRVSATDVNGTLSVYRALKKIKGIGFMFSHALCRNAGIDGSKKIGFLSRAELDKIEAEIKNIEAFPAWMLNRRKDPETGLKNHLVGNALDLRKREDINMLRKMRSYRGVRHELGLPVRGQRTRSTFRTNKTVGVSKKKALAAKKGAATAKPAEKK